jgi:tetratricopeptide (TPR) repeat protein
MRRIFLVAVAFVALALVGCGGPTRSLRATLDARAVDDETYEEVRRQYLVLAPDAPSRDEIRGQLFDHLAARTDALIAQGDYDAVVSHLAEMTELLAPADFSRESGIPEQIAPVARWIAERGARRGDEPRTLAALFLLSRIEPTSAAHREEYERVAAWGREARWGTEPQAGATFFDLGPTLISVWEEHARLSPATVVLDRLADLYVQMRDIVSGRTPEEGFAPGERISLPQMRMAQLLTERMPLDIAAIYLRVGDLTRAAERVAQLGEHGGIEWRLRRLIEVAAGQDEQAAEALGELSGGFERVRPDVAIALCRIGHRNHPNDARFPLCLARLSAASERPAEASAWYADAVTIAPSDRMVYDEAIERLARMIEGDLSGAENDIGRIRMMGRYLELILAQYREHWPNDAAAVSPAELQLALGRAEANAGHAREAIHHLERSIEENRSRDAVLELAMLRHRLGDYSQAIALYREALDRSSQQGREAALPRAMLLEQLGDALRSQGEMSEAREVYTQALSMLRSVAGSGDEAQQALIEVRIGIVESRLGQEPGAEFLAALDKAPSWRELYIAILSHLVVSEPNLELAEEVFARASTGLALSHEWRVYFALWVQTIAGRASEPLSADVVRSLRDQAEEPGWHGRLSAFAAGTLPFEELVAAAENKGQLCEAHFYAGTRDLARGDVEAANTQFREALETGMVSYFEYMMAQELLGLLSTDAQRASASVTR